MQLMLYHRLLSNLAANNVDASTVFDRYRLDPSRAFSDAFVAELASLQLDSHEAPIEPEQVPSSSPCHDVPEILKHNSLLQLWSLMIQEFMKTIPSSEHIGHILKAEFRSQRDGAVLGTKSVAHNEEVLDAYLDEEMKWWKGERAAKGVEIEEAFKCRICEFADVCDWRRAKVDEATEKHRQRSVSKKSEH